MLKDITLGQYFPGKSFIHRLDPRMKIIFVTAFVVFVFVAKNVYSFAAIFLATVGMVLVSEISLKVIFKSIRPVLFLMIFTAVINIFLTKDIGQEPLWQFYFIEIYKKGVINAAFMLVRIVCLVTGTGVLLTYTTSPITLTDAIERLLKPLKKLHVPVHEFAMMMTIALRFIPTLIEETDKIISAQKARGAAFDKGGIIDKVKAFIPILIPLFISAFRRADELACAMECRCYRGDEGRTRMKILKMSYTDMIAGALFIVLAFLVVFLNGIPTPIGL